MRWRRLQFVAYLVGAIAVCLAASAGRAQEAALASSVERPAPTASEIAGWIGDLNSREYRVREQATRQLLTAGDAALAPLLAAANGDQPEPADRAIWIMQRLAQSSDQAQVRAALSQLIKLRDRPKLVAQAESQLSRIEITLCERQLKSLGADCTYQIKLVTSLGAYVPVFQVIVAENWRGTADDLRQLAELQAQQHFELQGPAIDDAVVKHFESRPALAWLHMQNTKVTARAIDALKAKHPHADIFMKNQAIMGVACQNSAAGALVMNVQPGEAAHTAGVIQGDVITAIDGEKVPDFDRLTARVAQHQPGDKIEVEVLREGQKRKFEVTLGSWAEFDKRQGR